MQFTFWLTQDLCQLLQVQHFCLSGYYPETDWLVERFNQMLKHMLCRIFGFTPFELRNQVLLLVPSAACKFLTCWQGPYTIKEWIGPIKYHLQQPVKKVEIVSR